MGMKVSTKKKMVKVEEDVHTELSELGSCSMSRSDVIKMLIAEHKERRNNSDDLS